MRMFDLIEKKKNGKELTETEIKEEQAIETKPQVEEVENKACSEE